MKRDINTFSVNKDVTMVNELMSLTTSSRKSKTVKQYYPNDVPKEAKLKPSSSFFNFSSLYEQVTELFFTKSVRETKLAFLNIANRILTILNGCLVRVDLVRRKLRRANSLPVPVSDKPRRRDCFQDGPV